MKLERKAASGIMLTLLLVGLTLALNIQPVKASGTIFIRPDGSVDPLTTPIQRDGDVYTFTDNIYDEIVVEKSNIIIDGAGFTLQGTGAYFSGIYLLSISNVTMRSMNIKQFTVGILLYWYSNNNNIFGNNITNNDFGIWVTYSSNNNISENNIKANNYDGIVISYSVSKNNRIFGNNIEANTNYGVTVENGSSNNTVSGNKITDSWGGLVLSWYSNFNSVSGNDITENNGYGILFDLSSNNLIYHNNFRDNAQQVYSYASTNFWDDGYPSGGNHWSDYAGVDSNRDGIGDTPYAIDENNQDRYPLMNPWKRKVGVRVGEWARYGNFVVTWRSSDPSQYPPLQLPEWMDVTVQNIVGTNITFQLVIHYKTSAEESIIGWQDVSTSDARGQMGMPLFISADLSAGDTLYQTFFPVPINETVFREYVGATRETNHIAFEWAFSYIAPDKYFNGSFNAYWDRATGILTEYMLENVFVDETLNYVTSASRSFQIIDTNLWEAPVVSAAIDIDPDTLNLRSKGKWTTAYIELPEGYNPADINASTILLNGTILPVLDPVYSFVTNSSEYLVDHNGDGILERMVKFDRAKLASWICSDLGIEYGNVTLTVAGELFDGTSFEGTDTVKVLFPGDADNDGAVTSHDFSIIAGCYGMSIQNPSYSLLADFNEDGYINSEDFSILAANYGRTAV